MADDGKKHSVKDASQDTKESWKNAGKNAKAAGLGLLKGVQKLYQMTGLNIAPALAETGVDETIKGAKAVKDGTIKGAKALKDETIKGAKAVKDETIKGAKAVQNEVKSLDNALEKARLAYKAERSDQKLQKQQVRSGKTSLADLRVRNMTVESLSTPKPDGPPEVRTGQETVKPPPLRDANKEAAEVGTIGTEHGVPPTDLPDRPRPAQVVETPDISAKEWEFVPLPSEQQARPFGSPPAPSVVDYGRLAAAEVGTVGTERGVPPTDLPDRPRPAQVVETPDISAKEWEFVPRPPESQARPFGSPSAPSVEDHWDPRDETREYRSHARDPHFNDYESPPGSQYGDSHDFIPYPNTKRDGYVPSPMGSQYGDSQEYINVKRDSGYITEDDRGSMASGGLSRKPSFDGDRVIDEESAPAKPKPRGTRIDILEDPSMSETKGVGPESYDADTIAKWQKHGFETNGKLTENEAGEQGLSFTNDGGETHGIHDSGTTITVSVHDIKTVKAALDVVNSRSALDKDRNHKGINFDQIHGTPENRLLFAEVAGSMGLPIHMAKGGDSEDIDKAYKKGVADRSKTPAPALRELPIRPKEQNSKNALGALQQSGNGQVPAATLQKARTGGFGRDGGKG